MKLLMMFEYPKNGPWRWFLTLLLEDIGDIQTKDGYLFQISKR